MTLGELLELFLSFFLEWVENSVAATLALANVMSFEIHWLEAHWLLVTISCGFYIYLFGSVKIILSELWEAPLADDTVKEFSVSIFFAALYLLGRVIIAFPVLAVLLMVLAMFIDFT